MQGEREGEGLCREELGGKGGRRRRMERERVEDGTDGVEKG